MKRSSRSPPIQKDISSMISTIERQANSCADRGKLLSDFLELFEPTNLNRCTTADLPGIEKLFKTIESRLKWTKTGAAKIQAKLEIYRKMGELYSYCIQREKFSHAKMRKESRDANKYYTTLVRMFIPTITVKNFNQFKDIFKKDMEELIRIYGRMGQYAKQEDFLATLNLVLNHFDHANLPKTSELYNWLLDEKAGVFNKNGEFEKKLEVEKVRLASCPNKNDLRATLQARMNIIECNINLGNHEYVHKACDILCALLEKTFRTFDFKISTAYMRLLYWNAALYSIEKSAKTEEAVVNCFWVT